MLGLPLRTLRILKLWWLENPKSFDLLRPFALHLAEIISPKIILYMQGRFQLNPHISIKYGSAKTSKVFKNIMNLRSKSLSAEGIEPEHVLQREAYMARFISTLPWLPANVTAEDWVSTAEQIYLQGFKYRIMFDSKSIKFLEYLDYNDRNAFVNIYNNYMRNLNFSSSAYENFYMFLAKGFGSKADHIFLLNEVVEQNTNNRILIGCTHNDPYITLAEDSNLNLELCQTLRLNKFLPTHRESDSTLSFAAPIVNQFSASQDYNLIFSEGFSQHSIQEMGSSTLFAQSDIHELRTLGILKETPYKYKNIYSVVNEYNAKQEFFNYFNPPLGGYLNPLCFEDQIKQAIYEENVHTMLAEIDKLIGKENRIALMALQTHTEGRGAAFLEHDVFEAGEGEE